MDYKKNLQNLSLQSNENLHNNDNTAMLNKHYVISPKKGRNDKTV